MAESGCLRDVHAQNLDVSGLAILDTFMGKRKIDNQLLNVAAASTVTLTRDQSGTLFTIDGTNNNVITLPAVNVLNVGCVYEFLVTTAIPLSKTTKFVIGGGAGEGVFYATILQTGAGAGTDPATTDVTGDTLTLIAQSAIGTRVILTVVTDDGTNSVIMAEVHSDKLATVDDT